MKSIQRLDQHEIHRHPHRPTPVRIPAKRSAVTVARAHSSTLKCCPSRSSSNGLSKMHARNTAHAIRRQKRSLIQHPPQQRLHPAAAQQRQQAPRPLPFHIPVRNQRREIRPMRQHPLQPFGEFRCTAPACRVPAPPPRTAGTARPGRTAAAELPSHPAAAEHCGRTGQPRPKVRAGRSAGSLPRRSPGNARRILSRLT